MVNIWNKLNLTEFELEKIFSRIQRPIDEYNDCWIWIGPRDKDGYGIHNLFNIQQKAHRLLYECYNGFIKEDFLVRHKCHNSSCVNPNHLHLGTQQDNQKDKILANRQAKGEQHGRSILTEKDINNFLINIDADIFTSVKQISEFYNVKDYVIKNILNGKSWTHITKNYNLISLKQKVLNKREYNSFKLSNKNANDIRLRVSNGEKKSIIASDYNISPITIYGIIKNRIHK